MRRPSIRTIAAVILGMASLWLAVGRHDAGGARPVVVTVREIEAGNRIEARDLAIKSVKGAPDDAARDLAEVEGRFLRLGLLEGEPIPIRRLAPVGSDSISAQIPPGKLAVAFTPASRVDAHKGDLVLISATLDSSRIDTHGNPYRVVAERARVIAVEPGERRSITVILTPEERSFLQTGSSYGIVDAALAYPSG